MVLKVPGRSKRMDRDVHTPPAKILLKARPEAGLKWVQLIGFIPKPL